ncbi:MAG: hypothetical protein ABI782_09675 [Anaerolineaceae bacterium]
MSPARRILLLTLFGASLISVACGGSTAAPAPTSEATVAASPSAASPTSAAPTASVGAVRKLGTSAGIATTAKDPSFTAIAGAKATFGKSGSAVYQVEMPDKWNGEVAYYAHGFAGFGTEVSVDAPPKALREQLISNGYAWAASSYSENGYVPGIGADDTLALKRLFEEKFGNAKRSYLIGASMGGNVVALSLENFPNEYDGALAVCGALAGEEQIDFLTSWVALAEFTSGVKIPISEGSKDVGSVLLQQLPKALGPVDAPTDRGKQFASSVRQLTGGPRPFFLEGFKEQYLVNFGLVLLDPERKGLASSASTNEGIKYAIEPGLGLTSEQLDSGVRRFKADPKSRDATTHPDAVPTTGKISNPLLTLHGTGDLFVPISQEQSYRKKVDAAGKGDLLVQRAIRSGGHCKFSAEEFTAAFTDLVAWVKDGKKPKGDDLLGDLSDIGKQFTNPIRPGDPGMK